MSESTFPQAYRDRPKVYLHAYNLISTIYEHTRSFPKQLRPTVGRRMEESSVDLALTVLRSLMTSAQKPEAKEELLEQASHHLDVIRLCAQISTDQRALTPLGLKQISENTTEIGKELGGLIKYQRNQSLRRTSRRPSDKEPKDPS